MRLFGPRKPDPQLTDRLDRLDGALAELALRVATLESEMHPARLAEWHELAEKLKRYLQRISTVEQRIKDREDGAQPGKPNLGALLRMKFPNQNGG